jgi:8-oxo-dGTP pyrophosphatase MutT (NUDIX family)
VLLVFHARLGRWLQPGGHLEPTDQTIVGAARREVLEETGVTVDVRVAPALVGVDVHEIPAGPAEPRHYHHDLMFRFVAAAGPPAPIPDGERVAWCPLDRLPEFGVDAPLRRCVERARLLPREA